MVAHPRTAHFEPLFASDNHGYGLAISSDLLWLMVYSLLNDLAKLRLRFRQCPGCHARNIVNLVNIVNLADMVTNL